MLSNSIYLTTCTLSLLHAKPFTNPTTFPDTSRSGCIHQGKFYPSGASFGEGNDGKGWCYGMYCDDNGHILAWDNFKCSTTPITKTLTSTTSNIIPPSKTTPPAKGCEYEGKFYSPGEEIKRGIDMEKRWCYGSYCGDDGHVIAWDNFNCTNATSPLPTWTSTMPNKKTKNTTTPLTTVLSTPSITPSTPGCVYNGKFYSPGVEIEKGRCHTTYCTNDSLIIVGDFICRTTSLPSTALPFRSQLDILVYIIISIHLFRN